MKAFLSHSSSDKELVSQVARHLGNARCVYDEISFEPGRKTLTEIFKGLGETDLFVFFISRVSLDSDWVQAELLRANELLEEDQIKRILPIIIDKNITYKSEGIPDWLSRPYNLRYMSNAVLIQQKIDKALKELQLQQYEKNKQLDKIFVGRNKEIEAFEADINNLDGWIPSFIVAHSFYDGMGRRSFLKHAMIKAGIVSAPYFPLIINLEPNDSIENVICKLCIIDDNMHPESYDFSTMDLQEKKHLLVHILTEFVNNKEIIFFVDRGAIVLPSGALTEWFEDIITSPVFENQLTCCLLSTYKPKVFKGRVCNRGLCYDIAELNKRETQILFIQFIKAISNKNIDRTDLEFFLSALKGIPNQIKFAAEYVSYDLVSAKNNINEILTYTDEASKLIADKIREKELDFQILLLLAKSDVITRELVYKVFGDNESTNQALANFQNWSIIEYLYSGYEYIHLSSTMADFLARNHYHLSVEYSSILTQKIRESYGLDLDLLLANDYSQFLITIQSMIENKQKIPSKYYIPAFVLKSIVKEYDRGNYDHVIEICEELISGQNSDPDIMKEMKYFLELAYARRHRQEFYNYIDDFKPVLTDYLFLHGFFLRNRSNTPKDQSKAQEYFEKVLEIQPQHQRARRELVNTLLAQERYDKALQLAKENYESNKLNIFHLHSYFLALIRREQISKEDKEMIDALIDAIKDRQDVRAQDFYRCMQGEYEYYINGDFPMAKNLLDKAINQNENGDFPRRALERIEAIIDKTIP